MLKPLEVGALFPFLPEGPGAAQAFEVTITDLVGKQAFEQDRRRGRARVEAALEGEQIADFAIGGDDRALLEEVLSYVYSRMLVSGVNDSYLTSKYCLSEAKLLERRLKRVNSQEAARSEGQLSEAVQKVLEYLQVRFENLEDGRIAFHFSDYLRYAPLAGDKNWALTRQDLSNGQVRLPREKAFRVMEEVYRARLLEEFPLTIPEALYERIRDDVEQMAATVAEIRAKLETGGVLDEASFPPCIKHLMEMTGKGENVPHMGRFTMVAFLHTIGYDKDGLISLFSRWPDFNIQKSMYQIQHIIGETSGTEYTPPMCSTMKTYGICFNPDQLCQRINHPLNYYRRKLELTGKLPREPPKEAAPTEEAE